MGELYTNLHTPNIWREMEGWSKDRSTPPPPKRRCVSRYVARHYRFIYRNHNPPSQWLGRNTNFANYLWSPMSLFALNSPVLYLLCLCHFNDAPFLNKNCPGLNNKLYGHPTDRPVSEKRQAWQTKQRQVYLGMFSGLSAPGHLPIFCSVTVENT